MDRGQLRAARALLGWSQEDLVEKSGVSLPTIKRIESESAAFSTRDSTIDRIKFAFTLAGVEFIDEGFHVSIGGPGIRLTTQNKIALIYDEDSIFKSYDVDTTYADEAIKILRRYRNGILESFTDIAARLGSELAKIDAVLDEAVEVKVRSSRDRPE